LTAVEPCGGVLTSADAAASGEQAHRAPVPANMAPVNRRAAELLEGWL